MGRRERPMRFVEFGSGLARSRTAIACILIELEPVGYIVFVLSHTKVRLRPLTVQYVRLVIPVHSANVAHSAE